MNQPTTDTRPVTAHVSTAAKLSNLDKAIALFAFSDLTVRPCGHGLPPTLPWRQDDWTLDEVLKSNLRKYSITDREVRRRLEILDHHQIEYDHIYVGHQDKKPLKIPQKVVDVVNRTLPVLAGLTVAILGLLMTAATFAISAASVMLADPVVIVAVRENDGSYNLLEIAKWYG